MRGPWRWQSRNPGHSKNPEPNKNPDLRRSQPVDGARARRRAHRRGYVAEFIALSLLVAKGYRVLAWRFTAAGGEIDLIVARGPIVAFVEVKARHDLENAYLAIDYNKRRKLARAVNAWLMQNPWACERSLRMDAVYVTGTLKARHHKDAFSLE